MKFLCIFECFLVVYLFLLTKCSITYIWNMLLTSQALPFSADPPLLGSVSTFTHVCVCVCVISWLNCLISLVLDDKSFWNLLETFLGCFYTSSKWFWISCMSVSLLVGLLSYWNLTNIGISPVLDDISFWIFLEAFLGCLYTCSK